MCIQFYNFHPLPDFNYIIIACIISIDTKWDKDYKNMTSPVFFEVLNIIDIIGHEVKGYGSLSKSIRDHTQEGVKRVERFFGKYWNSLGYLKQV